MTRLPSERARAPNVTAFAVHQLARRSDIGHLERIDLPKQKPTIIEVGPDFIPSFRLRGLEVSLNAVHRNSAVLAGQKIADLTVYEEQVRGAQTRRMSSPFRLLNTVNFPQLVEGIIAEIASDMSDADERMDINLARELAVIDTELRAVDRLLGYRRAASDLSSLIGGTTGSVAARTSELVDRLVVDAEGFIVVGKITELPAARTYTETLIFGFEEQDRSNAAVLSDALRSGTELPVAKE